MVAQGELLYVSWVLAKIQRLWILSYYRLCTVLSLKMLTMSVDYTTPAPPSPFFFFGPLIEDSSFIIGGKYMVERTSPENLC